MANTRNLVTTSHEQEYLLETLLKYLTPLQMRLMLNHELTLTNQEIDWLARETGTRVSCGRIRTTKLSTPESVSQLQTLLDRKTTLRNFIDRLTEEREANQTNG